ncbi:MAG: cell division protein ZapA [Elusimicrobia bacterium]|nr:cell division protein ZapA [Elusimicrobiota bacterium]
MLNEKVDIEIRRYKLTVEMEGLTPIEINALAGLVGDKMKEIEKDSNIVDTYKLALLTALEFAGEVVRLKEQIDNQKRLEDRKMDEMIVALQNGVEPRS